MGGQSKSSAQSEDGAQLLVPTELPMLALDGQVGQATQDGLSQACPAVFDKSQCFTPCTGITSCSSCAHLRVGQVQQKVRVGHAHCFICRCHRTSRLT